MEGQKQRKNKHWFHDQNSALDQESLNLVEFPLALLARKIPEDQKVVTFEDSIFDKSSNKRIERKLTISANVETKLPNYWDQDVLLALSVLTWRKNRFTDPVVEFSLREVLKLMGLSDQGANCKRLAASFDNWLGLRFKWSHWWTGDTWGHPKATVLIQDYDLTRKPGNSNPSSPQVFAWSRLYFEAMQGGKCKPFDGDFYFGLNKPLSKRLYRYLDKRFFNRVNYSSPISTFCTEKLGMARGRKQSQYPQKVEVAYDELIGEGYLADLPKSERYTRDRNGLLHVNFRRGRGRGKASPKSKKPRQSPIEQQLIDFGMTAAVATKWVESKPAESAKQIEFLEFKISTGWKPEKGAGGYLNAAIRDEHLAPKGFVSKADRDKAAKKRAAILKQRAAQQEAAEQKRAEEAAAEVRELREYLESLGDKLGEFKQRALDNAKPFLLQCFRKADSGSEIANTWLDVMYRDQMERERAELN